MKLLYFIVLIFLLNGYESAIINLDQCSRCAPEVMDNFNLTRSLGTWYYFAQSPDYKNKTCFGCFKQTITLKDSCTLVFQESYIDTLGQLVSQTYEKYVDPKRPNVMAEYIDLNVRDAYGNVCPQNMRVESTVLYTDYDCVKVVYSCTTVNNFWIAKPYSFYYIAVRDKDFDSINKILPALNYLRTAGVSCDNLQFLPLSSHCPN